MRIFRCKWHGLGAKALATLARMIEHIESIHLARACHGAEGSATLVGPQLIVSKLPLEPALQTSVFRVDVRQRVAICGARIRNDASQSLNLLSPAVGQQHQTNNARPSVMHACMHASTAVGMHALMQASMKDCERCCYVPASRNS